LLYHRTRREVVDFWMVDRMTSRMCGTRSIRCSLAQAPASVRCVFELTTHCSVQGQRYRQRL